MSDPKQMDADYIIHVLRNPYGHDDEMRDVRLNAANEIERLKKYMVVISFGDYVKMNQEMVEFISKGNKLIADLQSRLGEKKKEKGD